MGALEFWQAIVSHVAWPVVAAFALWLLRGDVSRLMGRLVSAKTPVGEYGFDSSMAVAKAAELADQTKKFERASDRNVSAGDGQVDLSAGDNHSSGVRRGDAQVDLQRMKVDGLRDEMNAVLGRMRKNASEAYTVAGVQRIRSKYVEVLAAARKCFETHAGYKFPSRGWSAGDGELESVAATLYDEDVISRELSTRLTALEQAAVSAVTDPAQLDTQRVEDYIDQAERVIEQLVDAEADKPEVQAADPR